MKFIFCSLGFLFIFLLSNDVNAQYQFGWVSTHENLTISQVKTDSSGNVYTAGSFTDSLDIDPGPDTMMLVSNGSNDIFLEKTDSLGNLIWAISIGGTASDACGAFLLDDNGDIYYTGHFNNTVDFDPGENVYEKTSYGGDLSGDIFVLKLNNDGAFLWVRSVGNSYSYLSGSDIAIDTVGDVYVTSTFDGTLFYGGVFEMTAPAGFLDGVLMKFGKETGLLIWAKQVTGLGTETCKSVKVQNNKVYVDGYFSYTGDFDPDYTTYNLFSYGGYDPYLLELDLDGNFIWAGHAGSVEDEFNGTFTVDSIGNVYMVDNFSNTMDVDFSEGTFEISATGEFDIYIMKIDTAHNITWVKQFGSPAIDYASGIFIDKYNNLIIGGAFEDSIDLDPGVATRNIFSDTGLDCFFAQYDSSGNFIMAAKLNSSGDQYSSYDIVIDERGSLYACGLFSGTVDFDPQATEFLATDPIGPGNAYLLKLKPLPCTPYSTINHYYICAGDSIVIDGDAYLLAGYYTHEYSGIMGCDSVIVTHIITSPAFVNTQIYSICEGESIIVGDSIYNSTGAYTNLFYSIAGCDSVINSLLTVNPIYNEIINDTICTGNSYLFNGELLTDAGIYNATLTSYAGCDSLVELHLSFFTPDFSVTTDIASLTANQTDASYQWMNCADNTLISGANDQIFFPDSSGNYAVIISINDCEDTSTCYSISILQLFDNELPAGFLIYPNPVHNQLTIDFNELPIIGNLQLIDINGQVILYEEISGSTEIHLNINTIPSGIYFIKMISSERTEVLKLMKN